MIRYQAHKEDNFKILLSIKRANHSNHFKQRDQDKTNKMFLKIAVVKTYVYDERSNQSVRSTHFKIYNCLP